MAVNSTKLARHVAILRVIFGLIWSVDAVFKWQPSFRSGFLDQINLAGQGQPSWLQPWFQFWTSLIGHDPHTFAVVTAIVESLIAIALLVGFARRSMYLAAAVYSLLIWSIAEGFGGPYTTSSTDIGVGVIYAVVFFSLYGLERLATPPRWAVDNLITKKVIWWKIIANP